MTILTLFILALCLHITSPPLIEARCAEQAKIVLHAVPEEQTQQICQAAEQAISFLAQYNLHAQKEIGLELIDGEIENKDFSIYGNYDSRTDRIQIMSYEAIFRSNPLPTLYDEPFDKIHYAGAIAHEVAHAIFQQYSQGKPPGPAPQEYLAHATQLGVMPKQRREALIKRMAVGPWQSGDAISDIYMALQPAKFAVKSYLHLTSLDDPQPFLKNLINAKWFYIYVP